MEVFGFRIIHVGILLRDEKNHPIFRECLIDCLGGAIAVHEKRNDHVRKHDQVRQRQHGQNVRNRNLLLFRSLIGFHEFHAHSLYAIYMLNSPACTRHRIGIWVASGLDFGRRILIRPFFISAFACL